MDGFQATEAIRRIELERHQERPTPVIALTALAFQAERERCSAAGMDDFLSKPFESDEQQTMLRRWLPDKATQAALAKGRVA